MQAVLAEAVQLVQLPPKESEMTTGKRGSVGGMQQLERDMGSVVSDVRNLSKNFDEFAERMETTLQSHAKQDSEVMGRLTDLYSRLDNRITAIEQDQERKRLDKKDRQELKASTVATIVAIATLLFTAASTLANILGRIVVH